MHVLGSAGHVDHGKSSLLRLLTGMEPDRLPEEKRRGMTIDLNFVSLKLAGGRTVGIVDVPGHQRFVKNMISGTMAVDGFLFVCAADDGWMPQSEEHLAVLKSLGVRQGIGVLTKTDLVDESRAREVEAVFGDKLRRALGEEIEILRFSALCPDTLPRIRDSVERLVASLPPPRDLGAPRFWVDRVFVPKGLGVVATGTLREGKLREGDELELLPSGKRALVKGIESYHSPCKEAEPNARVAVLLGKVSASEVARGMLLQRGKRVPLTRRCEAKVQALVPLRKQGHYGFHVGTQRAETLLVPLDERAGFVRLRFAEPLALRGGDRFVLRTSGEERMVAAGVIVDPEPTTLSHKRSLERLSAWSDDAPGLVAYELKKRGFVAIEPLVASGAYTAGEVSLAVSALGLESPGSGIYVEAGQVAKLREKVRSFVQGKSGSAAVGEAELSRGLGEPLALLREVLARMVQEKTLARDPGGYRFPNVGPSLDPEERSRRERVKACLDRAGGQPLGLRELVLGVPNGKDSIRAMVKEGELVSLPEEHFIGATAYQSWVARVVAYLKQHGKGALGELRTHLNTSRKNAVVILERMDQDKITYLKDGVRRIFRDPTA